MSVATDRLPAWTVAAPFAALGIDLALHASLLRGLVHLIVLATWLFLIIVP